MAVGNVCSRTGQPCSRSPRGNFAVNRTRALAGGFAVASQPTLRASLCGAFLDNHQIVFGYESWRTCLLLKLVRSAAAPYASTRCHLGYSAAGRADCASLSRVPRLPSAAPLAFPALATLKRVHSRRDTASAEYRLLVSLAPERFYRRLAAVHLRRRLFRQANAPSFPPRFLGLRVFRGRVPNWKINLIRFRPHRNLTLRSGECPHKARSINIS